MTPSKDISDAKRQAKIEYGRRYREANYERLRIYRREYYRQYRKSHVERLREWEHQYRAKRRAQKKENEKEKGSDI